MSVKFIEKLDSLINDSLIGYEIDGDDGCVTLFFENGLLEFSGDDLEMYVELNSVN